MAKTLRTLSATGFTTKGNTLTWEELDQTLIDLHQANTWDNLPGKPFSSVGDNLRVVANALTTVATPSFAQVSLSAAATETDHAVRADRTLASGGGLTGGGNLTENRTLAVDPVGAMYVDEDGKLAVQDHGSGQTGTITAAAQSIYGAKTFQAAARFLENVQQEKGLLWDDATSYLKTDTLLRGFAGEGLELALDEQGYWTLITDNIFARRRLTIYELFLQQLRAGRGNEIFRSGMEAESVEVQPAYRTWAEVDETWAEADWAWGVSHHIFGEEDLFIPFANDDLLRQQTFDGRQTKLMEARVIDVENGSATVTDNTTARYAAINLYVGSDEPAAGDQWVALGNRTDPDRQGFVGIFSEDDDAPFIRIADGIDSLDKFGTMATLKGQFGKLDGLVDANFPTLDGTQTNEYGIYINGGYFTNVEVRGQITVLPGGNAATDEDVSDSLQAAKDYTDSQLSGAVGNETIRSDTAPTTRSGGGSILEGDTWIKTDEGDLPHTYDGRSPFSTDGWIREYTTIDGGDLTAGTVTANKLSALSATGAQYAGIQAGTGTTRNFFAGATDANGTGAKFYVTAAGKLVATDAEISGAVTIGAGSEGIENLSDAGDLATQDGVDWTSQVSGAAKPSDNADVTQTKIDGGIVTTGTLQVVQGGSVAAGITGADSGDGAVRFFAGSTFAGRDAADFRVTQGGALFASDATISGEVNATSGSFAGVDISGALAMGVSGVISGAGFTLNDAGLSVSRAIINEIASVSVSGPASVNNANYGDSGVLKVNNSGGPSDTFTVTGLANGVDGLCLTIISSGTGPVRLSDENVASTAANRFSAYDGNDVILNPGRAASLIYDSNLSRWRVFTFVV